MIEVRKMFKSFSYAYKGLKYTLRLENNLKVHCVATVLVLLLGYLKDLSSTRWAILVITIGLVFVAEILNTAIEKLVDLVSPSFNPKAGLVKDISAGAVLVAAIIAVVVGIFVFVIE